MRGSTLLMAATIVAVAALSSPAVQALPIWQFDKMALSDQKEYVIESVEGAQRVLGDQGHADLAEQVAKLFTANDPQSSMSIGMTQFDIILARARVADLQRLDKNPTATRLEVEHAIILVLRKNGIELPKSYMHVMDAFHPKHELKRD